MNARAEAGNRAVVRSKNLGESSNPRPFEGEGLLLFLSKSRVGGAIVPHVPTALGKDGMHVH